MGRHENGRKLSEKGEALIKRAHARAHTRTLTQTHITHANQAIDFHSAAVCLASTGDPARGSGFLTFADDHVMDWMWNNRRVIYGGVLADAKVAQRRFFVIALKGFTAQAHL